VSAKNLRVGDRFRPPAAAWQGLYYGSGVSTLLATSFFLAGRYGNNSS